MADEEVIAQLVLEGLSEFLGGMQDAGDSMSEAGEQAENSGGLFAGFGDIMDSVASIASDTLAFAMDNVLTPALGFLTSEMGKAWEGALEGEQAMARIEQVIRSTGGAAGLTAEGAQTLADRFAYMAGGTDDAVLAIEEIALRMGTITANEMPLFIEQSLDLGAVMGDNAAAARLLARMQEDPIGTMGQLRRAGVLVSESLEAQIKSLVKAGDSAGATALLMDRVVEATGGAAAAQINTTAGTFELFSNILSEAAEGIMAEFLPAAETLLRDVIGPAIPIVTEFAGQIGALASGVSSAVVAFLSGQEGIGGTLRIIGAAVDEVIPGAYSWFLQLGRAVQGVVDFFVANMPAMQETAATVFGAISEIVAVLAGVFYESILPAINELFGTVTTGAPSAQEIFTALMTAIKDGATIAAAFVKDVLAPAIAAFADWARTNLIPLLGELVVWLQTNLPVAIQFLTDAWNNVIYPALVNLWTWITGTLLPTLSDLWTWINATLPAAIQVLTDYWNNTLQPALSLIVSNITTYVIPLLTALATVVSEVVRIAFEGLVNYWNTTLFPKIDALITILNVTLMPILNTIGTFVGTTLTNAFASLQAQIELVTSVLWALADVLSGIHIPDDLQPGSPTPFELGLRGIGKAAQSLTRDLNPLDSLLGGMNGAQIGLGFTSGGAASISQLYVQMMRVDNLVMAQSASEAPSIYAARGGGATSSSKTLNFTSNNYGRNTDPPSMLGDLSLAMAVL